MSISAHAITITDISPSAGKVNVDRRSEETSSTSLYPSDSESICESNSSTAGPNEWVSAGAYVPVHRRARASSDVSGVSNTSAGANASRTSTACSVRLPDPQPHPQVYSRADLLSLAPSSLIHASLHPIVTPALVTKHPKILRARGDGIARALDMARQDGRNATSTLNVTGSRTGSALRIALVNFAQSDTPMSVSGRPTVAPGKGAITGTEARIKEPVMIPTQGRSSPTRPHVYQIPPVAQGPPQPPSQPSKRQRRRRAAYQHNFARSPSPTRAENASMIAKLGLDSNSKAQPTAILYSIPTQRPTLVPTPNSSRPKRQLDVNVLSSWRAQQTVVAA